jgi:hypothetical protein
MPTGSLDQAVSAVRAKDSLAVPLATGIPGGFLHALGAQDRFEELEIFGGLLRSSNAYAPESSQRPQRRPIATVTFPCRCMLEPPSTRSIAALRILIGS